jgi:DNA-binding response OmpR family regulator
MQTRILAIDDDEMALRLVTTLLEAAGYQVRTAVGGLIGLKQAEAYRPDLILLDVQMPDLDGYEVCRRLRKSATVGATPIIMLTATQNPKLNGLAYAAGAQACVPKPFRREALFATIEAIRGSASRKAEEKS